MDTFIQKLITGEKMTDRIIADHLYEICDREHSSCNSECPVYAVTNSVPNKKKSPYGCDCFKHSDDMLQYLRDSLCPTPKLMF